MWNFAPKNDLVQKSKKFKLLNNKFISHNKIEIKSNIVISISK